MQLFLNNWSSALTLPATASAVQLSVPEADANRLTGLGTGDHYLLTLATLDVNGIETAWEVVRVTGHTAGVLDVLRGQEGTTALELEAATAISARLTKATMETLRARAEHTGEQAIPTITGLDAALTARALIAGLPSRDVTASSAVTPSDAGNWLICDSATPITLTIGAEATAAWTTADILPMFHILQVGAGAVAVTGDGFIVALHAADTNVTDGAGAAATALWRAADTWSLIGRLVAA